jgi:alkylresorcinol/alkylpyrone synthase
MYLHSIGTAVPDRCYSKRECWDAFTTSAWFTRLNERSRAIAKLVLSRDNGIDTRWLAVDSLDRVFDIDADVLHRRYADHAPLLITRAGQAALQNAGLAAREIDAVVVTTCTGYLCPGLSTYAIERLGLSPNVLAFDLVGQGCAGALPNWQLADALLESARCETVLSICVEICSAAMYLDDDPGVLISACLFGDGAGAAVLSRRPPDHARRIRWTTSMSLTDPANRESLRFEARAGLLRNVLTREVPRLASLKATEVLDQVLSRIGLTRDQIHCWIVHAGGRDVLAALQEQLQLDAAALDYSRTVLRDYGNLSSAFVYFVIAAALADAAPGGWWWLTSFGAGFSCHGALLAVDQCE